MQKRKTAGERKAEQIEQKWALGVLHRIYADYLTLAQHDTQRFNDAYRAFQTLARTIHGEPTIEQQNQLCDECHEVYGVHWVLMPHTTFADLSVYRSCCTPCKDRLLAKGKLFKVDGKPVTPPEAGEEGTQA